MESVGFSPDRHPEITRRGAVAFVVFATVEQRNAALVEEKVCWALMDNEFEFQLLNRPMRCEPKDPEKNVALDRREAGLMGAAKRQRRVERELPKPLDKATGAGGSTGLQRTRCRVSGPAGLPLPMSMGDQWTARGGEEALREMNQQANELVVEQLGRQLKELFTGLTQKQEEDNRRLREENLAIRKQMLELEREKLEQNNRMELLMAALLRQVGGEPLPSQAVNEEMTPMSE